jgi:hypothetical protein
LVWRRRYPAWQRYFTKVSIKSPYRGTSFPHIIYALSTESELQVSTNNEVIPSVSRDHPEPAPDQGKKRSRSELDDEDEEDQLKDERRVRRRVAEPLTMESGVQWSWQLRALVKGKLTLSKHVCCLCSLVYYLIVDKQELRAIYTSLRTIRGSFGGKQKKEKAVLVSLLEVRVVTPLVFPTLYAEC